MSRRIVTKKDLNPWPLAVPSFTLKDKLKIGWWLIRETQWTAGKYISDYEQRWSIYTSSPHVVMVSSGSTANELIALRRKWELERSRTWYKNNKVLVPVCTWISSISPWVNIGFEPVFTDVGENLNMTFEQMKNALDKDKTIKTVFYTSLLGYAGDINKMIELCEKRGVRFLMDNCEASLSMIRQNIGGYKHICNLVTSSTSIYFSHFTTSGTEGGLIFCRSQEEADWYRMMRSHGMTRNMPSQYRNPNVDPMFDFYLMGTNYRSSNLQAYMASLDFDRAIKFGETRFVLSNRFGSRLNEVRFEMPHDPSMNNHGYFVPLSLPIICKREGMIHRIKGELKKNGIEYRQIVSGSLAYQTAFKKYKLKPEDFPRADWIHNNGLYIGLHEGVDLKMIIDITDKLNMI